MMLNNVLFLAESQPQYALFWFAFWLGVGLIVVGVLLLGLLTPESPAPGPTQVTERGGYIPLVIGKHRVGGALLWRGARETVNIDPDNIGNTGFTAFKSSDPDDLKGVVEEGMWGLAIGCTAVIEQIYVNGKKILDSRLSAQERGSGSTVDYKSIDRAPKTKLRPYFGNSSFYDTGAGPYRGLIGAMGLDLERIPTWPNLTWIHFDKAYLGTAQPRWPAVEADIIVPGVVEDSDGLTFAINHPELISDGIGGVNPAYCLWVLLTGETPFGVGLAKEQIDKTSLNQIGEDLAAEEIWININTGQGRTVEEIVQDILSDCGITMAEVGGVLTFALTRENDSFTSVNEDSLSPPVQKIEILTTRFQPSCVEFQFNDSGVNFQQNTVTIENDGPDKHIGTKKNRKVTLANVTTLDVAERVAARRAQEFFALDESVTFKLARDAREIKPGEKLNISGFGLVRVSKVKYDYNSPDVTVEAYIDPFEGLPGDSKGPGGGGPGGGTGGCIRPTDANVSKGKTSPTPIRFCEDEEVVPDTGDGGDDSKPPKPPVTGVCCKFSLIEGITCSETTQANCDKEGGYSFIPGAACSGFICNQPPPLGSCCYPDGTCETDVLVEDCKPAGGTFFGGQVCEADGGGVNCGGSSTIGICCNPLNQKAPCYELGAGKTCEEGYSFTEGVDLQCDEFCCPVAEETQGRCCFCNENGGGPGIPANDCTVVQNQSQCDLLGGQFQSDESCCEATACDPCGDDGGGGPGPGDDISNDRYVRPIITPSLIQDAGMGSSGVAILRSRFNEEIDSMKGFVQIQPSGQFQNITGLTNSASLPAGTVEETAGFSIDPGTPPSLSYITEGPIINFFDNQHFGDLKDYRGVESTQNNEFWLSNIQSLLCDTTNTLFTVRHFRVIGDPSDRKAQALGMIPNRLGTPSFVDVYADINGDTVSKFAIPNESNGGTVIVPRKQAPDDSFVKMAQVSSLAEGDSPKFKSQPGIGQKFLPLNKVTTVPLNDIDGENYVNKLVKDFPIHWASAGNRMSTSQRQSLLGNNTSIGTTPTISSRGFLDFEDNSWLNSSSGTAEDIVVEAAIPSSDLSTTPTQLPFGTREFGGSVEMRVILWEMVTNFGAESIITGQKTIFEKTVFIGNTACVPMAQGTITVTNSGTGMASITLDGADLRDSYYLLNQTGIVNMNALPFANGPGRTYIQVTSGLRMNTNTKEPATALIGLGGFGNLPYFGTDANRHAYYPSVDPDEDVDTGHKIYDVSNGYDFFVTTNFTS